MANYNKVIMIGNLTRDPELRYLPSQTAVCELGLAVNRRWKGADGQQREETCFVDCTAFGKPGEVIKQYMAKGRSIMIEGRLQLDTWEGKDGTKRSKHRIVIENFQFLGGAQGGGANNPRSNREPSQAPAPAEEFTAPPSDYDNNVGSEDIPF